MLIRERLAHKRPVFSFEFFPPKTKKGMRVLWKNLEQLAPLEPDYVSVTYGAGGSTRTRTVELVGRIKRELGIEVMAHLTCVGATSDEIARVLDELAAQDVENIMALRGDPPKGQESFEKIAGGFAHANELVAFIKRRGGFCVGAACYPEVHPEAESAARDLEFLRQKVDAGVDFLITQLFFDNSTFRAFERRAREAGITAPILPGIMPVTNSKQIKRFTKMCGASIPALLLERLEQAEDDPQAVFWTGVQYASYQCRDLLTPPIANPFGRPPRGVPGIHFYTLNKSPASRAIFEILRLSRAAL